jgi:hypothetical protein
MAVTAVEEKKIVTMHEAKVRDLQAKVNALLGIEKVRVSFWYVTLPTGSVGYSKLFRAASID